MFILRGVGHPHPSLTLDTPILARGFQRGFWEPSLCVLEVRTPKAKAIRGKMHFTFRFFERTTGNGQRRPQLALTMAFQVRRT